MLRRIVEGQGHTMEQLVLVRILAERERKKAQRGHILVEQGHMKELEDIQEQERMQERKHMLEQGDRQGQGHS